MKVFISHSYNDNSLINEFIKALERLECEVFYSSKAHTNLIGFGENFYNVIRQEIQKSDFILAMVSNNFYNSIPCQVEMGIAYAFNKKITPIAIENKDYRDLLKGIFTTNERLASIYKEDDIIAILSLFSKDILKVSAYTKDVIACISNYNEARCEVAVEDKRIVEDKLKENYIEDLLMTGQLNINECLFLMYMVHKRRYRFEWAWQKDKGIGKFEEWLISSVYSVEGEVSEVYSDIINHFCDLGLLTEVEMTSEGNVRLYGFKHEYARQLTTLYNKNPEIIDNECNKQSVIPF
ncbi:hypothetical protein HMPREF1982_00407 [Clostridiales bacterium oral taxon 876 str. F0540]|nr:hypothetical protein HMPREF1982_00407 [Clostridiales bacterium oral taxon 876 str. F0540]